MKRILYLILLQCFAIGVHAQTITGKVMDTKQQVLPGVSIAVEGSSNGTITGADGSYTVNARKGETLVFSFIGMLSKSIVVGNSTVLNVTLEEDSKQLNEVVVTALGIERDKRSLGYATQQLNSKEILDVPRTNVVMALQGKVAGAQISSQGGAPGQGARILIRGVNSLSSGANNQPLFVVDGIPISNDTDGSGGASGRAPTNRAADINLDDVETINVLKGGAATALYGVRAANGVIIITTKKGKNGKTLFNVRTSYGVDEVNKVPATQGVYTQGFGGNYDANSFWPTWGPTVEEARALDPNHPATLFNNYENAYDQGSQSSIHFDASGGNEKTSFYSSVSRSDQEGVVPFTDFSRTSAKLSGNVQLTKKFSIMGSANFINSGGARVDANNFNTRLVYWAPQADVTDYEFTEGPLAGTMKPYRLERRTGNNPIYGNKTNVLRDNVNRLIGSVGFNYSPIEGLDLSYRFGIDRYNDNRRWSAPGPRGIEGEAIYENNGQGFTEETRISSQDITSNFVATYQKELNSDFDLTLRGGVDLFERDYDRVETRGEQFEVWDFIHLSNAANITTSQVISKRRLIGLYGEAGISYKDFLFFTVTNRNDWSSTLPAENNSFSYPSFSLGYVFTDMIPNKPNWLDFGKFRASYAQIGKDAIGPYLTSDVYRATASGFPIGDVTGWTRPANKADLNLLNERTTDIELGLEFKLLKNRVGIDLAWYRSNARDQILGVPISAASGFNSFTTNAGEIQNSGLELLANVGIVQSKAFNWNMNINFSNNRNKIVSIREGIDNIFIGSDFGYAGSTASMFLNPGLAYGNILGTTYKRYYENPEDEDPMVLDPDRPIVIGENGFPVRDTRQKIIGNSVPRWMMNIGNELSYKGFTLGFNFDFRQGFQKFNSLDNFHAAFGIADYTLDRNDTKVFEGVLENGEPNTKEVWLGQGTGPDGVNYGAGFYRNTYRGVTENFVEDASWVRLQNLSLTYDIPSAIVEKLALSRASISLTGTNLWLSTPYSGFDPEVSVNAGNADGFAGRGAYPGLRSYAATLRLSF